MNSHTEGPYGAYFPLEHHLLKLALVSEVTPRANAAYAVEKKLAPQLKREERDTLVARHLDPRGRGWCCWRAET